ncbi:TIGR00266 family protein [Ketobacter sp. MCCC 1A13808]|uniref:TIGR00266 family protein n=1 Tax=Ketobacter sp. MCCC 1A13808 TaxID=2602738 RepID=UPI000F0F3BC5|nr:TIGR00266 family protein [Ketobacter sp. MCCC 1A13808]MVF11713.1 TIGR00266 family protein [Ketobacter sp. MCCC 1A13808]RLP55324.1 MAG: TIGR00266 family protein [Ketobacter sp.]
MKTEIKGGVAFSYLDVELEPGESITTESDAMSSMDADIELRSRFNGGFFIGLLRKFLGGETLFINDFTNSTQGPRRMTVVQPTPGQVRQVDLNNETLYMQPGAFLACSGDVKVGVAFAGFISWIAREGLFRIAVSGSGTVWYGAFGALLEREVDGEFIVDTSHLVAYEPGIKLKLQLAGGIFSSLFGGEGLVTRVVGKGKIVIQSRSISGIASWINPRLP